MALVPEDDLPGSLRSNFVPESDLPSDLRVGSRRPEPKPKEGGFFPSVQRGAEELYSSLRTAVETGVMTPEEAAKRGLERKEKIGEKYAEGPSLEKVKKAYEEKGLLSAAGELASQIPEAIGQQVPQLGTMALGARLGAAAGAPFAGVGAIPGAVIGGTIGLVLPNLFQQYGTNIERQAYEQLKEAGKVDDVSVGRAMAGAVPQAALDVVADRITFGKQIFGKVLGLTEKEISKKTVQQLEKEAAEKLLPRISKEGISPGVIAKGTARGVVSELPTEVAQQIIERAQAGLPLTSDEALAEYGDTAYQVSLLGPLGILGKVSDRGQARKDYNDALVRAKEENKPQEVVLQLAYDPNVPNSTGEQVIIVNPDGSTSFPSEKNKFAPTGTAELSKKGLEEKYAPQPVTAKEEKTIEEAKQLGYDPTAGQQQFYVFPDGSVATTREAEMLKRYAPQLGMEGVNRELSKFVNLPEMPEEINQNVTRFAFVPDNSFNAVVTEGELVKRSNGSQWIRYYTADSKAPKFKSLDSVTVDPTEDDIIGMEEKAALSVIKDQPNAFLNFLARHGVKQELMADVIGDSKKSLNKKIGTGKDKDYLFRNNGLNLDELVDRAVDEGFMTAQDREADTDLYGTNKLSEMIQDAYNGDTVVTPAMEKAEMERMQIQDTFDKRRRPVAPAPTLAEEDLAPLVGAEREAEIVEAAEKPPVEQPIPAGAPITQEISAEQAPIELAYKKAIEEKEIPEPKAEVRSRPQDYYTDKFLADGKQLAKDLRAALDRMGLKNVGLNLEDSIYQLIDGKMTEVNGNYFDKLIQVSLSGDNMLRTLNHEAIHAMKQLGFFSDADWAYLTKMANEKWLSEFNIAERYPNLSAEEQVEEAIADAFAKRQAQNTQTKSIITRVVDFLKRVANVFRGHGFRTEESIFSKAAEGKLKPAKEAVAQVTEKAEIPFVKKIKEKIEETEVPGRKRGMERGRVEESLSHVKDRDFADRIIDTFSPRKVTIGEKLQELKPNFYERIIQGLFDEFRTIKKYGAVPYMLARLSKSVDGALEGLLIGGQLKLTDGALDMKQGTKGLQEILKPVGKEIDNYFIWKALNRDARLPVDKQSYKGLNRDVEKLTQGTLNGKSRKDVYNEVLKQEHELNKSVLDIAKQQGLIDDEAYKRFSEDAFYIPFYRMLEEGDVASIQKASKLTGQEFSKTLKGGERMVNDFMENILMNWSHILSASMKNKAAIETLKAAQKMDAAKPVKRTTVDGTVKYYTIEDGEKVFVDKSAIVKVMENGKESAWLVTDPDLVSSISNISYLGPKNPYLNVAKNFTNWLRYGVTLSPAYKIRNLIRDTVQSAAVSPLSANLYDNVARGMELGKKDNPVYLSNLVSGGIFHMGAAHEGDQATMIRRVIKEGKAQYKDILDTPEKIKSFLSDALDKYNDVGNKFENANRLALYDQLIKEGKSHLEASFAARDLMDFSLQGSFGAVKTIAQIVPFFNARLQGLYKLGRDGITPTYRVIYNMTTGEPIEASDKVKAQHFGTVMLAVGLASALLYMTFKDDEDFKKREDWDRDNFWWFKIGDRAVRIPKPFEIGAFGTIVERGLEQMVDKNVEGKVFGDRLRSILWDTFSLNPTPQVFKPLIDLYANKDSFTGAPIESAGLERLSKQERMTDSTSELAKQLGGLSQIMSKVFTMNPQAEGMSPVQVDYAIKAYFGWLGSFTASTSDLAVRPFKEGTKPLPPFMDTALLGFVKELPEQQSKWVTQFYESNHRIQNAYADMRHYAELGNQQKVAEIMADKKNDIALAKIYDKASKDMSDLRSRITLINNIPDSRMNSEEKRENINRIKLLISKEAELIETVRKNLARRQAS